LKYGNGMVGGQPVTTVERFLAAYVESAAVTCEWKMLIRHRRWRHKDTNRKTGIPNRSDNDINGAHDVGEQKKKKHSRNDNKKKQLCDNG
jgi:hypothetical protein